MIGETIKNSTIAIRDNGHKSAINSGAFAVATHFLKGKYRNTAMINQTYIILNSLLREMSFC
jgi:hypothetical protein